MEIARFFRGLETLGVEVPPFLPYLVVAMIVGAAFIFARAGRKRTRAAQSMTSELSSRLAEIDPADYDFEGNKKPEQEPAVNFDDFFSNSSRREELRGAENASEQRM